LPYATEFSITNYEKAYHFVEGLMTYWKRLKLVEDLKVVYKQRLGGITSSRLPIITGGLHHHARRDCAGDLRTRKH